MTPVPATPSDLAGSTLKMARYAAACVSAGVIGFGYRALSHRSLTNDHYMHMAWAQQLMLGELPGRDFVDPGMPLMYVASAVVQHIYPGPFSEALLASLLLGAAAAATCAAVLMITGSIPWALTASLLEIAAHPRLYSYPKLLAPAVAVALLAWYCSRPSAVRLWTLGAWTSVSAMLRYDLGVYVGIGVLAALLVHRAGRPPRVRALLHYSLATAAVFMPWMLIVHQLEGLPEHVRGTIEFTKADAHQLGFGWPRFSIGEPWAGETNALALLFYLAYLIPIVALPLLWFTHRRRPSAHVAVPLAAVTMLALYLVLILRHPLEVRIRDTAALVAIAGAWVGATISAFGPFGAFASRRRTLAASVTVVVSLALAVITVATWRVGHVSQHLSDGRFSDGIVKTSEVIRGLHQAGSTWPWDQYWPAGPVPDVVRYLHQCTSVEDRVLLTWSAPEYYFFSRRGFGAGHALLLPPAAFSGIDDQQRMLARLRRRFTPFVLINETRRDEFASTYPLLDEYLRRNYDRVGTFTIRDGSDVSIELMKGTVARSTYGADALPCGIDGPGRSGEPHEELQNSGGRTASAAETH